MVGFKTQPGGCIDLTDCLPSCDEPCEDIFIPEDGGSGATVTFGGFDADNGYQDYEVMPGVPFLDDCRCAQQNGTWVLDPDTYIANTQATFRKIFALVGRYNGSTYDCELYDYIDDVVNGDVADSPHYLAYTIDVEVSIICSTRRLRASIIIMEHTVGPNTAIETIQADEFIPVGESASGSRTINITFGQRVTGEFPSGAAKDDQCLPAAGWTGTGTQTASNPSALGSITVNVY